MFSVLRNVFYVLERLLAVPAPRSGRGNVIEKPQYCYGVATVSRID